MFVKVPDYSEKVGFIHNVARDLELVFETQLPFVIPPTMRNTIKEFSVNLIQEYKRAATVQPYEKYLESRKQMGLTQPSIGYQALHDDVIHQHGL